MIIDANPNIDKADPIFKAIRDNNNKELTKLLQEYTPSEITQLHIMSKRENYRNQQNYPSVQRPYKITIVGYALLRCNFEALCIIAEYDYSKEYLYRRGGSGHSSLASLFNSRGRVLSNIPANRLVNELLSSKHTVKNLENIKEKSIEMLKCLIEIGKYEGRWFSSKFTLDLCTDLLPSTTRIKNVLKTVKSLPESEDTHRFLANYYLNEAEELGGIKFLEEAAVEKSLEYAIFLNNYKEREMFIKRYLYGTDPSVQEMQQKLPKIVHRILTRGFEKEYVLNALKHIKKDIDIVKNKEKFKKDKKLQQKEMFQQNSTGMWPKNNSSNFKEAFELFNQDKKDELKKIIRHLSSISKFYNRSGCCIRKESYQNFSNNDAHKKSKMDKLKHYYL